MNLDYSNKWVQVRLLTLPELQCAEVYKKDYEKSTKGGGSIFYRYTSVC